MTSHPTGNFYNWLAHKQLNRALASAARLHATGRLVDIGCGLKPYREMFEPYVVEHVGVDHPDSPHASTAVDVLATAYSVPFADESFDTVLLTEVLEHLENPVNALYEVHRLLRPGGALILTTPFIWPLHEEPRDFFRYSSYGLQELLRGAEFVDMSITPLSGQWGTVALLLSYALRRSPISQLGRGLRPVVVGLQKAAWRLDQRTPRPWMSWNHLVVAHKAT